MDDAEDVFHVLAASDTAALGAPDCTLADAVEMLSEDVDLGQDTWLLRNQNGQPVAFAITIDHGDLADIDVFLVPGVDDTVALGLLDLTERRVRERATAACRLQVTVTCPVYRSDVRGASRMKGRGYAVATTFHRMRIDLADPLEVPSVEGVTLRRCASEADQKAGHHIREVAFADHFGHIRRTFEEWRDLYDARTTFDWPMLWLAESDGQVVGMCLTTDQFDEENAGYVQTLGVLPRFRGRGIARLLLLNAFEDMRKAGRVAAYLGVDTANTTNAVALYESVGMRPVLQADMWQREILA
jgi:ribosomal protein S18 acetylase RimI-like enzyme